MKTLLYHLMLFSLLGYPVCGEYYEITTDIYKGGLTLYTGDSLYMTNGGFDSLTLFGSSTADIEGTSPLQAGSGGIWFLSASNASLLEIAGGQINHLDMNGDAMATLSGGSILEIQSSQHTKRWDNDNGLWIDTPHIFVVCLTHTYDDASHVLTGHWLDGSMFRIQLIDVEGYSPAIDNFQFIPEPAGLVFLTLGGLFLHKNSPGFPKPRKFMKKA